MWIARDSNGELWLYTKKPVKNRDENWVFSEEIGNCLKMDEADFPGVHRTDEEPTEVEIVIKQN